MIDINKKYRTRDGREVTHLHRAPADWPDDEGPWRGIVGGKTAVAWADDGTAPFAGANLKLIEVREPRELWIKTDDRGQPVRLAKEEEGDCCEVLTEAGFTLFREVIE